MTDLNRIAVIRNRRAERAMQSQRIALSACIRARAAVSEAEGEIQAYAAEIKTLEFDLLSELVDRQCTTADIMDVQTQLDLAQAHAERLHEQRRNAHNVLNARERSVEHARFIRARAERKLTKITEMNSILTETLKKENQAKEDAEIDTFSESMPRSAAGGWV